MKRTVLKVPYSETEFKYTIVYESEPCTVASHDYKQLQYSLLQTVVSTPGLLDCGPVLFSNLKMFHNGDKWIIELEAISS